MAETLTTACPGEINTPEDYAQKVVAAFVGVVVWYYITKCFRHVLQKDLLRLGIALMDFICVYLFMPNHCFPMWPHFSAECLNADWSYKPNDLLHFCGMLSLMLLSTRIDLWTTSPMPAAVECKPALMVFLVLMFLRNVSEALRHLNCVDRYRSFVFSFLCSGLQLLAISYIVILLLLSHDVFFKIGGLFVLPIVLTRVNWLRHLYQVLRNFEESFQPLKIRRHECFDACPEAFQKKCPNGSNPTQSTKAEDCARASSERRASF